MLLLGLNERKLSLPTAPALTTNLLAWFPSFAGVNAGSPVDGDPISTRTSQSGSLAGAQLVQATSAAQPTWRNNIQNGLPMVKYGGSQYMTCDSVGTALAGPNAPYTVALAFKYPPPSVSTGAFWCLGNLTTGSAALYLRIFTAGSPGSVALFRTSDTGVNNTDSAWSEPTNDQSAHVVICTFDGASPIPYWDGAVINNHDGIAAQTFSCFSEGTRRNVSFPTGVQFSNCYIGELGVWSDAKSAADVAIIYAQMKSTWGTP